MAYNPNETVKLKHLNEFAAQLGNKLDGRTNITRQMTDFTFGYGSNSITMPADGVCSFTTDANIKICNIKFKTTLDSAPQILNFNDDAEENKIGLTSVTFGGDRGWSGNRGFWLIDFSKSVDGSQRTQITPRTITFTLHFDATTQYDAYDKIITVNITAAE